MTQKNNQGIRKFAYKNDTGELVELGQFLRDAFQNKISVKREWFVIFDRESGKYLRTQEFIPRGFTGKYRTPDLIVFPISASKKTVITEMPILCLEDDGKIHVVDMEGTLKRNKDYERAGIDLVIVDKQKIKISVFDDAYGLCEEIIKRKLGI